MKMKRTTANKKAPAKRTARLPRRLPSNACTRCPGTMKEHVGTLTTRVNGEAVAVPRTPHLHCPDCGEIVYRWNDMVYLDEQSHALYRAKYGLLSPEEIKALRGRLGMTQQDLAHLLRLGGNTISRWEAGRNVQTAALDVLLRMIEDLPGSVAYLRAQRAA